MSAIVWVASAGISIVTGGAAGYLSSVYSADPVAKRQAVAQRRIAAERLIADIVTDYIGRIRAFEQDPQYVYPEDYAAIAGRERFAEDVLAQLSALRSQQARFIETRVGWLVGSKTMDAVEPRLGVPTDARIDAARQAAQHEVIEREIRLGYQGTHRAGDRRGRGASAGCRTRASASPETCRAGRAERRPSGPSGLISNVPSAQAEPGGYFQWQITTAVPRPRTRRAVGACRRR